MASGSAVAHTFISISYTQLWARTVDTERSGRAEENSLSVVSQILHPHASLIRRCELEHVTPSSQAVDHNSDII